MPRLDAAIWDSTEGLPSGSACADKVTASTVMPPNMVTASTPIAARVAAALRACGARNAGTPLLIASTPVRAVQPDANARTSSTAVRTPPTAVVCRTGFVDDSAGGRSPNRPRATAKANIR